MTEGAWRTATANELRALDEERWAASFASCGRWVRVWSCAPPPLGCGADDAVARRPVTCSLRGCPSCARLEARRKVARMTDAVGRVADTVFARMAGFESVLTASVAEHKRLRDMYMARGASHRAELVERAARREPRNAARSKKMDRLARWASECELKAQSAQERGHAKGAAHWERQVSTAVNKIESLRIQSRSHIPIDEDHQRVLDESERLAKEHDQKRSRARRHLAQVQAAARNRWSWKLVTVSPPYDPLREDSFTVEGLQRRVDDVVGRVSRVWDDALSAGGLAAATMSVEISDHGHIHAHILTFGPWVEPSHVAKVAGCHVDLRRVEPRALGPRVEVDYSVPRSYIDDGASFQAGETLHDAIVEAVKYTIKLPSETHAWLSGEKREVTHPALVARWMAATRSRQLTRHYGLMRDCIEASEALKPDAEDDALREEQAEVVPCRHCGRPVELCPGDARKVRLSSWVMRGPEVWRSTLSMTERTESRRL